MSKIAQLIASMPLEQIQKGAAAAKQPKAKSKSKGRKSGGKEALQRQGSAAEGIGMTAASGIKMAAKIEALFAAFDEDKSGELDTEEFVKGIMALPGVSDIKLSNGEKLNEKRVTQMAKVVDHSGDGQISILELLEAFCFEDSGGEDMQDSLAEHMLTVLFRHRQALRAGARCFDVESTGAVTRDEFQKILMALNKVLSRNEGKSVLLEAQVSDLCDALSMDGSSGRPEIIYEDFFNSFLVVDRENPAMGVRLGRRHHPEPDE